MVGWIPMGLRDLVRGRVEVGARCRFLCRPLTHANIRQRWWLLRRFDRISAEVHCPHKQGEILRYVSAILSVPSDAPGIIVEAGAYRGGSTAKLSLAAALAGRPLVVLDSFEGLPAAEADPRPTLFGKKARFEAGQYAGSLPTVMRTVGTWGDLTVCRFVPGWFDQTTPRVAEPIAVLILDVDLVESVRTCLRHLYPHITPGGVVFSHDGHLPGVQALLSDETFWRRDVGCPPPVIRGLGVEKVVEFPQPAR